MLKKNLVAAFLLVIAAGSLLAGLFKYFLPYSWITGTILAIIAADTALVAMFERYKLNHKQ
jgi:uncharacterized membrane-anchored protein